jgi:N-acetylmuramoyl-L-alanine amidase
MTTMFKNRIVKEITVYTLIFGLFINTGLAGVIGFSNRQGQNALHKPKNNTHVTMAKVQQTGQHTDGLSGKTATDYNNEANNQIKYDKPSPPNTAAVTKVAQATAKTNQSTYQLSSYQYQILVRTINAEAGGEPFEGQVAVAAVLLNRIRSGKFPTSISANVFRSGEFESVSNGYIWDTNPSASSYQAASLALKGWDPTAGSLYFYNPAKTTSRWIWSRPIYTIIGNHYFAG